MLDQVYQIIEIAESHSGIVVRVGAGLLRLLGLQICARKVQHLIVRTFHRAVAGGASPSRNLTVIYRLNSPITAHAFAGTLRKRIEEISSRMIASKLRPPNYNRGKYETH